MPDHGEAWQRLLLIWHGLFYALLSVLTGILLVQPQYSDQQTRTVLFSGLLALWYALTIRWQRQEVLGRDPYLLAYFVVGWLVWFALTYIDLLYMFLLLALFPHVFITLKQRWANGGALLLAGLAALRQTTSAPQGTADVWLIIMLAATLAGIGLATFINAIIRQSSERRELIAQLEAAQRDLALAERAAGIFQERARLAREIHDTLAQGLISIVTQLEAAESVADDPHQAQTHVQMAKESARDSLTEARRFVWELRTEQPTPQAFELLLRETVAQWSRRHALRAQFISTGTPTALSPLQQSELVRILGEALVNIAHHAQAQQVTVTLSYLDAEISLDVQDDGIGFDPAETAHTPRGGFGLIGMRERAEALGGRLIIESAPQEGTTIVAQIPLQP